MVSLPSIPAPYERRYHGQHEHARVEICEEKGLRISVVGEDALCDTLNDPRQSFFFATRQSSAVEQDPGG